MMTVVVKSQAQKNANRIMPKKCMKITVTFINSYIYKTIN